MRKLVLTVVPVLVLAFSAGGLTGCKNKWVKRAEAIEKAACACKDVKCAKEQHKALREYIKDAKKVKVKKSDAKVVAKAVTKASKCIYTLQRQSLRKKPEKK